MINIDKLIYSKRHTIQLQITSVGGLVVRAPNRCPMKTIERFIIQKEAGISSAQAKIHARQEQMIPIYDNFQILLQGKTYQIVLCDNKKIEFSNNSCCFPRNYCARFNHYVMLHYKKLAKIYLTSRVEYFASLMQQYPTKLRFSNTKTSWGSCNSKREIALNWRLMMVDPSMSDYVIVHELSHLLQMNHSQKFWQIVQSVIPNYKIVREMLKRNDFLLSLYRN